MTDSLSGSPQPLTALVSSNYKCHIAIMLTCVTEVGSIQYERAESQLSPTCRSCGPFHSSCIKTAVYESGGVYYSAGSPVSKRLGAPIRWQWARLRVAGARCSIWPIVMKGTLRRCVALVGLQIRLAAQTLRTVIDFGCGSIADVKTTSGFVVCLGASFSVSLK